MTVAVIGSQGWVGRAMMSVFPNAVSYDIGYPGTGTQELVNSCDVAFVCVPTPNNPDGSLDTSIVEEVVGWLKCPLIVIRSTLQPGTAERLERETGKNIVVQPEYLGETAAHPLLNESVRPFLVIGGKPANRRKLIELYWEVYNANIKLRQVTNLEAEVIKLSENRAILYKVAQAQELYDACEVAGVDYYTIRDTVYGDDPRFDLWFTAIYPEARGANSKCIPKDVLAWKAWAESVGFEPKLTKGLLTYNQELIG